MNETAQDFDFDAWLLKVNEWTTTRPRPLADNRKEKSPRKRELHEKETYDISSIKPIKEKSMSVTQIMKGL